MLFTHCLHTTSDDRNDFPVFEGLAILHYLTKHYDPENKLSFAYDSDDYSIAEQWMAWQHGGLGPMYVPLFSPFPPPCPLHLVAPRPSPLPIFHPN